MMGEPIDLTVPDQYLLAAWATKTVLVASLSVPGAKRLVPANLYRWFEKHQVPLPRSVISLSHYVGGDAFNCVFAVGHLGFCVFVPDLPGDPAIGEPAPSRRRVKIWPVETNSRWSPPITMTDADLEAESTLFPGLGEG